MLPLTKKKEERTANEKCQPVSLILFHSSADTTSDNVLGSCMNVVGWQYQQTTPTVQRLVEEALTRVTKLERDHLGLVGASRTDAGVHAWGQVWVVFMVPKDC